MTPQRSIANPSPATAEALAGTGETVFMLSLLSGVARADVERYVRHSPLLARLSADLRTIELRLGTGEERPADLAQAQALGHQIRNILCMTVLADEARTLFAGSTRSGSPFPVCA